MKNVSENTGLHNEWLKSFNVEGNKNYTQTCCIVKAGWLREAVKLPSLTTSRFGNYPINVLPGTEHRIKTAALIAKIHHSREQLLIVCRVSSRVWWPWCHNTVMVLGRLCWSKSRVVFVTHIICDIIMSITRVTSWCHDEEKPLVTSWWHLKSPASRLFTQPFIQAQINEHYKTPGHWPLCGEFTGEFRSQRAINAENVSIWRRHHALQGNTFRTIGHLSGEPITLDSFHRGQFCTASIFLYCQTE